MWKGVLFGLAIVLGLGAAPAAHAQARFGQIFEQLKSALENAIRLKEQGYLFDGADELDSKDFKGLDFQTFWVVFRDYDAQGAMHAYAVVYQKGVGAYADLCSLTMGYRDLGATKVFGTEIKFSIPCGKKPAAKLKPQEMERVQAIATLALRHLDPADPAPPLISGQEDRTQVSNATPPP